MTEEEIYIPEVSTVRDAKDLINSLFANAKIDAQIVELIISKEEVVISVPQIEDYENELKPIERRGDFERAARYLAAATIATENRHVQTYTRFYVTSKGSLKIEDCHDDNVTVVDPKEIDQPERWGGSVENALRWAPVIIQIALKILRICGI